VIDRLDEVFGEPVDVLIHLVSAVSAECEADLDLGMSANVDTTRALLEAARAQSATGGPTARVVFSNSVAVYGSDPMVPLPPLVSESTLPTPRSSYGTQKLVCEQLFADYTRRGFVESRLPGALSGRHATFVNLGGPSQAVVAGHTFRSHLIRVAVFEYPGADAVAGGQGNAVVRRHAVDCSKAVREASKTRCGSSL
jgi:hypothetical protein